MLGCGLRTVAVPPFLLCIREIREIAGNYVLDFIHAPVLKAGISDLDCLLCREIEVFDKLVIIPVAEPHPVFCIRLETGHVRVRVDVLRLCVKNQVMAHFRTSPVTESRVTVGTVVKQKGGRVAGSPLECGCNFA